MKGLINRINRKGQSIAEYAIVLGLVTSTVVGVQVYIRHNLQHKIVQAVDAVGTVPDGEVGYLTFTDPTEDASALTATGITGSAYSAITTESGSTAKETIEADGVVTRKAVEGSTIADGTQKFKY